MQLRASDSSGLHPDNAFKDSDSDELLSNSDLLDDSNSDLPQCRSGQRSPSREFSQEIQKLKAYLKNATKQSDSPHAQPQPPRSNSTSEASTNQERLHNDDSVDI
jgi:hypothetical protein